MVVYQLQYLKSRYAAPITRNYMLEDEARMAAMLQDVPAEAAE
jgi:hypothetical protein